LIQRERCAQNETMLPLLLIAALALPQGQTRDPKAPPAQTAQPAGKGAIAGTVVSADRGQAVRRARVVLNGGTPKVTRAVQTDDEWLDFARMNGQTTYHVTGTCKMGQDPLAVVDDELRVHGVAGLRVIDASIMPTLVSGNTNAAVIMIAEKGADMIKAAAQPVRAAA